MKIKTSELTDAALDWAVAKAADYLSRLGDHWMVTLPGVHVRMNFVPGPRCAFSPSTRWAQGGPIIEQERICITYPRWDGQAVALKIVEEFDDRWEMHGPAPLVAAMRCYVASKLGAEVDVPENIC